MLLFSEILIFLAVIVLIYLFDCIVWVPNNSVAFASTFGNKYSIKKPVKIATNNKGGFVLLSPFPPLTPTFIAHFPIIIFSRAKFFFNMFPPVDFSFSGGIKNFEYHDVSSSESLRKKLIINNDYTVEFYDEQNSKWVNRLIQQLKFLNEEDRIRSITRIMRQIFDIDGAKYTIDYFKQTTKRLKIFCNLLLIYLILILPLIIIFGFTLITLCIISGMLGLQLYILFLYHHHHKTLYPSRSEERITNLIRMSLCPPSAIRAYNDLGWQLLSSYNPLILAFILCNENDFKNFAKLVIRGIMYPGHSTLDLESKYQFSHVLDNYYRDFLEKNRINISELTIAPEAVENCVAYCPRCNSQFSFCQDFCPDCAGVKLVMFPDTFAGEKR